MRWTASPLCLLALLSVLGAASCKKAELPAQPIKGAVLEKLDASVYTYLRLKTSTGEVWAAVPRSDVEVGAEVVVQQPKRMDGFESKGLNRRFDRIVFGTLAGQRGTPALSQGSPQPHGQQQALPPGHPPLDGAAGKMPSDSAEKAEMAKHHAQVAAGPSDAEVIDVPKAEGEGAHTVAEVWAKRADLKGAKVKVRAKVVKATRNVMGRTFLHVRDGTGTAGKDNDLTVTTTEAVEVGEVVTLTGTVSVDRDFGAGYAYPVIVEGATLAR